MTANTPVYDGDEFRGVIGVDLSMAQLVNQLDAVQPTESGFAFYIDSTGSLVQSASSPKVAAEVADGNEELQRILQAMTWTTRGRSEQRLRAVRSSSPTPPWRTSEGGWRWLPRWTSSQRRPAPWQTPSTERATGLWAPPSE
jgi:hypothetical protein